MKKKKVYCVECKKERDFVGTIDANGELLLTCECGSFLKFATAGLTAEELDAKLASYKEEHKDLVTADEVAEENEAKLEELLG